MSDVASRWFAFLVYPDEARPDWVQCLQDLQVDGFISPLHEPSKDDSTAKNHYHVMLRFDGQRTLNSVQHLIEKLLKCYTRVQCIINDEQNPEPKAYALYLCHLTKACKAQGKRPLDKSAVVSLGRLNYEEYICNRDVLPFILRYIHDQHCVVSYDKFIDYVLINEPSWVNSVLRKDRMLIMSYILAHNKHYEFED